MKRTALLLLPAAAALALTACSSDGDSYSVYDPSDLSCATTPAPADTKPEWTVKGATGEAQIAPATKEHGPFIKVDKPFTVTDTEVKTLVEGDGPEVAATDTVYVCYEGVNGRSGEVFDSAYQRGQATDFPVSGVVPGFQKALIGQKGGSSVAVVMTPADGYGPMGGNPPAILADDTLIFELKIAKVGE
ncbi:peptidylprolyl isomerase [Gordonia iterans]|uniref:Peptidyl-prolyl cis-trans isomerase n=1 Tax=Gordonia iterans TaxID=1004901 RepID=A0A2S0KH87_9ACTN|nr:FKBP-type peptidyl-prolyl cis-trans isomerase [Gordonia iterans]AVM01058.1 peptidylprolyl isomerase [Gordonia iterans]